MRVVKQKDKVLDLINRFPTKTNRDIAKETNCNEITVGKYRKKIDLKYDTEFVKIVAGKFIKAFGRAEEYWLNQIGRLEELKLKKRTITITDPKTKLVVDTIQVDLEPLEILAIEKHQTELQEKILYLASAGRVRTVINMMRVGKIPMLERE